MLRFNFNKKFFRIFLVILILVISVAIVYAIAPNPGHSWTEMEKDGNLTIDTVNGRVGIGTTSPSNKLDVEQTITQTSAKFGPSFPVYLVNSWPGIGFNAYHDGIWKLGKGSTAHYGGVITSSQNNGQMSFYTTDQGAAGAAANLKERLTILNNGNVGIGTADPGSNKLRVSGGNVRFDGTSGGTIGFEQQNGFHRIVFDQLRFWDWGGGGDMVTFQDGNVGIGTADPGADKLKVVGSIRATGDICTDAGGGKCLSNAGGGGYWQQGNGGIYYDAGNVGIGTGGAPAEKLKVAGKIQAQEVCTDNGRCLTDTVGHQKLDCFITSASGEGSVNLLCGAGYVGTGGGGTCSDIRDSLRYSFPTESGWVAACYGTGPRTIVAYARCCKVVSGI